MVIAAVCLLPVSDGLLLGAIRLRQGLPILFRSIELVDIDISVKPRQLGRGGVLVDCRRSPGTIVGGASLRVVLIAFMRIRIGVAGNPQLVVRSDVREIVFLRRTLVEIDEGSHAGQLVDLVQPGLAPARSLGADIAVRSVLPVKEEDSLADIVLDAIDEIFSLLLCRASSPCEVIEAKELAGIEDLLGFLLVVGGVKVGSFRHLHDHEISRNGRDVYVRLACSDLIAIKCGLLSRLIILRTCDIARILCSRCLGR